MPVTALLFWLKRVEGLETETAKRTKGLRRGQNGAWGRPDSCAVELGRDGSTQSVFSRGSVTLQVQDAPLWGSVTKDGWKPRIPKVVTKWD
jgi:hypothetical protein